MSDIKKAISIFGSLSVLILLLFQLERWSLYALGGSENLYITISGILFLILGMIINRFFYIKKRKQQREFAKSSLSHQELRVLSLIAEGNSNKEIAEQLFIAETTVKSHVSNILAKLNAKRRTEAVKIGKALKIV